MLSAVVMVPTASRSVHIYGTVTNHTGSPAEMATVMEQNLLTSSVADMAGFFRMDVGYRDTIVLIFRMVGHIQLNQTIVNPSDTVLLNVTLSQEEFELLDVTVTSSRKRMGGNETLEFQNIRLSPDAAGGTIESMLATQPGVSSRNELSSQYNVRGGNFDENSVYVNGTEIFRPLLVRAGQQEGLSFINPDMVESISFSTGGFDVVYGDKMSSALDIAYKQPKEFGASASVGLLGANLYAGAAIGKLSFSNSLRYKTNRYLLGTLDTKGEYNPTFLDYQAYLNWSPNRKWNIGLIGNIARNSYQFTPSNRKTSFGTAPYIKEFKVYFDGWEKDLFSTLFGALSVEHVFNGNNSISLNASAFNSVESETFDISGEYWLDDVDNTQMFSIGRYMEHARNYLNATIANISVKGNHDMGSNQIKWGVEVRSEKVNEKIREWENRDSSGYTLPYTTSGPLAMVYSLKSDNNVESNRLSGYLQDTYRNSSDMGQWSLTAGLRASYWNWNKELIISPRISAGFVPANNENLTFRLAAGIYYQSPFYKEIKDTSFSNGIAIVNLNKKIKSQRSIQLSIGGDYTFQINDRPFRFTTELYYKKLDNLIPYNINNVRIVYYGKNCAKGYAVGIDTKLFGEFVPGVDSWITFSLMKTEEQISDKWAPRPSDQRYNLSLFFSDYFPNTDKWTMNLRCVLSDGLPFGPPHSGREQFIFRAPAYKRVDIGMSYLVLGNNTAKDQGNLSASIKNIWLGLDCFNLFNIDNVNSYFWLTDVNNMRHAVPNYLTKRQLNLRVLINFGK